MTKKASKKKASKKKVAKKSASKKFARKSTPRKGGKPNTFTAKIAKEVLGRLANGESLRRICRSEHLPHESTVRKWVWQDEYGDFSAMYARARDMGMDAMADEILDIADDGTNDWQEAYDKEGGNLGWKINGEHVQRSRMRVDTRKWLLSKIAAKRYGDRLNLTKTTELEDATDEELALAIKQRLEGMAEDGFDLSEYLKSNGGDT